MIEGISHITLIVRDLDKTTQLLKYVFDAQEVYSSGVNTHSLSPEKFFLIGGVWIAIMCGEPLPIKSYNHIAFKISSEKLEIYRQRLLDVRVEVMPARNRSQGEGESLYFYDFDNHLFELHAGELSKRLDAYAKELEK